MKNFDEYIESMIRRRAKERAERLNAELARGLKERTHAEAVEALFAGLTFIGGVSDILTETAQSKRLQTAF
ncbi:MAG: hypothetical protein IJZ32_00315 [Clostridia bacterium]|nr:hypothetical protein [Clostridia bacterium]